MIIITVPHFIITVPHFFKKREFFTYKKLKIMENRGKFIIITVPLAKK
ncbi:hypothetical protein JJD26997_0846 [Campylobacter jejuni subsp. doylei 269.97]|uniref:Uncharacterized protein n=1 Tax=Campylobacter jejuni subsp. doylei (strain ATCC BAA-1458 / RM4099 / 269.97) TaxID=360109 RepID=A7H389_CAMJD|nr:hypothetical protein JJD26997_0846 [Campylobacter jejuni subsp. doylei 269.97]